MRNLLMKLRGLKLAVSFSEILERPLSILAIKCKVLGRESIKPAVALTIVLSMAGLALAGSTASVTVSCSIPVMPGLNAPLIEEETVKTQESINAEQKIEAQKESPQESITLPQRDIDKEEKIVVGGNSAMAVKTYYSR